jgi:serine/threonine-protein kinase
VAYLALRNSYTGLYRTSSDGTGTEELLHRNPGAQRDVNLADWSMDGRFLTLSSTDLSGGTLYALPLGGDREPTPIELFRSVHQLGGPRLSPDSRFLAYVSNQSGRNEIYVRVFDPSAAGTAPPERSWQVSDQGAAGAAVWRRDGKELYYAAPDGALMMAEVSTTPTFTFGKPRVVFRPPEAVVAAGGAGAISPDGERVVIAVHPAPTLQQITVFDRQGIVVRTVGEPGRYVDPSLSPDGTRVAIRRGDPRTGNQDVWVFDIASGRGTPLTNDIPWDGNAIWSPNGGQVAYVSAPPGFNRIYLKAWDGGTGKQVFQYTPGASLVLTDWSADGEFLTFHDGCEGVLHVLRIGGDQHALDRNAIEWLRDEYDVAQARFSPDARFMAYLSNETDADTADVYVRPFEAGKADVSAGGATPVRVSTAGTLGMIVWRQDGKELYYLTPAWEVMAVEVTTTPTFRAGTPRQLFKVPGPLVGDPAQWKNVSGDGQRFVFAISVPATAGTSPR